MLEFHPEPDGTFLAIDAKRFEEICDNYDELKLVGIDEIGFSGSGGRTCDAMEYWIKIIPSTTNGYWHVSLINVHMGYEEYSNKPMTLRGFVDFFIKTGKIEVVHLIPQKIDPIDSFHYDKNYCWDKINLYVIQANIGGPVKIGKAKDVKSRIESFQMGCPFKLVPIRIFKNMPSNFEGELHRKYEKYRLHGEWFSEDIIKLINEDFPSDPISMTTKRKEHLYASMSRHEASPRGK